MNTFLETISYPVHREQSGTGYMLMQCERVCGLDAQVCNIGTGEFAFQRSVCVFHNWWETLPHVQSLCSVAYAILLATYASVRGCI